MTEIGRNDAERLVGEALRAVFDSEVVGRSRADSPLASLGMSDADAVAVAEAIAVRAEAEGYGCVLGDAEFAEISSVADLVSTVVDHARREPS